MKTGIKEYDNLPGRVGLRDVDYTRYKFIKHKKEFERAKAELDNLVLQNTGDKKWQEHITEN